MAFFDFPNGKNCARVKKVLVLLVSCILLLRPARLQGQIAILPGIATVAGNGTPGYTNDGGAGISAQLNQPYGVAVDGASNVYVADSQNDVIRKVDASTGIITTMAGNGRAGYSGDGGAATNAELNAPQGVGVDSAGNLYIGDSSNNVIRKVDASTGIITTVAGNGKAGYSGDGGSAISAQLKTPHGVAVDIAGNLYIADVENYLIRKVTVSTGIITTVAGNGRAGYSGDGGAATNAELNAPEGVGVDIAGNLYIGDSSNNVIRKVAASTGIITSVAGNGKAGYSGDGGAAISAEMWDPRGLTVDPAGNLYITDSGNGVIRKVTTSTGIITTVGGNGSRGYTGDGGAAASAEMNLPNGVAADGAGNLYVADGSNNVIREMNVSEVFPTTPGGNSSVSKNVLIELTTAQSVSSITPASSQEGKQEYSVGTVTGCTVDGTTSNAAGTVCTVPITFRPAYPGQRNVPLTVATNTGTYSVGLSGVGTAPQVAFTPGTITTVAGNGQSAYTGDGGAATSAGLGYPEGVVVDSAGNLYISDSYSNVIRKVDASGTITTMAGNGLGGYSGDGGAATSAQLDGPSSLAVDSAGNLYIADSFNSRIRKVDVSGTITTVAGNGTPGYTGDGGAATSAELNYPGGIALDGAGNLYIADSGNNLIRKVTSATGVITSVVGNGKAGYSGDGGAATSAELNNPYGVFVDNSGNLYIADDGNSVIRKVIAATGAITTVAGNGTRGYMGDGGAATSAEFNIPAAVASDSAGNLYIADDGNNVIRKVAAATGIISTVAGNGTNGYTGDGGAATSAQFFGPQCVVLDGAGNLYIADYYNHGIRKVNVSIAPTMTFATATKVGQTDSTDEPATVTVSNIGNESLTFTAPLPGSNPSYPADFPLNSSDSNLCSSAAAPVAVGANCDLSATFQPTGGGTNIGSVVLTDNALNITSATQSINLSGTGIQAPRPTCSWPTASSITYGEQLSNSSLSGGSCTSSGTSVPGTFTWLVPTTTLAVGMNSESVIFTPSDTADYSTVTGSVEITVASAPVAITTVSTLNPSVYGDDVTFTFTLSGISGGPTPTGSLTLTANGNSLGIVTLTNGVATYASSALPAGPNTITATYSGDSNYH